MEYRIEYYRGTVLISAVEIEHRLSVIIKMAQDEMTKIGADFVRIIDVDGSGAELWSARRDANPT